ncbi:MAG: hypothetical protein Q7R60_02260 [bacterium]|nr:hypothetical protein [bacterium]
MEDFKLYKTNLPYFGSVYGGGSYGSGKYQTAPTTSDTQSPPDKQIPADGQLSTGEQVPKTVDSTPGQTTNHLNLSLVAIAVFVILLVALVFYSRYRKKPVK